MKPATLRKILSDAQEIQKNSFAILKSIGFYLNDPKQQTIGRELVLRALEHRDAFSPYTPILDTFVRQVGLFPYLDEDALSFRDAVAYEFHRPDGMKNELVFHRAQAEIYRRLLRGENVIVSAPTSFGKSKIIDAVIALERYKNIAVIVPTIALIDETRRRLSTFGASYKLVTHVSQEPGERNVFIFTAERMVAYQHLPDVHFFAIDEFYKIGAIEEDETRTIALNQAFYTLYRTGAQYYMLGPNIRRIPDGLQEAFGCYFYHTEFATVVTEIQRIRKTRKDVEGLVSLTKTLTEPTLIFCRSPSRVNAVARAMLDARGQTREKEFRDAAEWVAAHFHPDWVFQAALKAGIGIHHGKLPRSLSQYVIRAFNQGELQFLICTSTIIEGVNTRAKNVVIFDNRIGRNRRLDFFTFNNIRGRSGRMFHHFIGKVFVFDEPPDEDFFDVDFPLFTQDSDTPASLLIQLDEADLTEKSKARVSDFVEQKLLPLEILRQNSGVSPDAQIRLAEKLGALPGHERTRLLWTGIPSSDELYYVCEYLWDFLLVGKSGSGVASARQLAYKVSSLMERRPIRERIERELTPGPYAAKSADAAVERVLEFDRNWAGFEFPRALMAMDRIQQHVFNRLFGRSGDYGFFATMVEALFRNPAAAALEEYGLPLQVFDKIERRVRLSDELDAAIAEIKLVRPEEVGLSPFEAELFNDTRAHL
ncbi:DEAD/DEAH box helicase [uncultured Thiohalocapsa sp.]|uniref:DEAD/DEAH box helicase n=1 Tax=uncultured Thiohalocapsa sp. TaxID=768990 RepID=UPI0025D69A09|nr:DEAD/DEAH box helicase [uncultured Thiohalocapsa sp.]